MKIEDMYPAVLTLVLIAILVAVGLSVLSQFSTTVRIDAPIVDDQFTAENATCEAIGTYVTTSSATFQNGTGGNAYSTAFFEWDATGSYAGTCVTLLPAGVAAGVNHSIVNVSYTRGAASPSTTATDTGITAIGGFTTWFAIIVVIIAASIIIGIVIKSFRN